MAQMHFGLISRRIIPLPVYNPRTRLVNFRLSEDEFQLLKETCARAGARSVSDFARAAVLAGGTVPMSVGGALTCADRWDRLEGCVNALQLEIGRLTVREEAISHG